MTRALLLLLLLPIAEAFVALPRRALRPAGLALRGEAEDAAAMLAEAAKLRAEIEEAEGSMSEANAILEKAYAEKKAAAAYVNPRDGAEPEKKKAAAAPAVPRKPAADAALAKALAGIGSNQDAFVKTLASLKAEGKASRWDSRSLTNVDAEKPTQARVRASTGINGAEALFTQEEVSTDQLFKLTAGVFLVFTFLALGSGVFIGGNVGASFAYLFAVAPLAFLGVGSAAPGLIVQLYQTLTDDVDVDRRRRHEAAHLVAGYSLGLPVAEYATGTKPRVEFFDATEGRRKSRDEVEALAAVALAGAVAECDAYGAAKGAQSDFATLQAIFDTCETPISNAEQQFITRRGVINAYEVLFGSKARRDGKAVDAVDAAMERGASLPEVLAALENA